MCIRDRLDTEQARSVIRADSEVDTEFKSIIRQLITHMMDCLLYTSDAADERSSVDLGGRRIIKKKKRYRHKCEHIQEINKIKTHNIPQHIQTENYITKGREGGRH